MRPTCARAATLRTVRNRPMIHEQYHLRSFDQLTIEDTHTLLSNHINICIDNWPKIWYDRRRVRKNRIMQTGQSSAPSSHLHHHRTTCSIVVAPQACGFHQRTTLDDNLANAPCGIDHAGRSSGSTQVNPAEKSELRLLTESYFRRLPDDKEIHVRYCVFCGYEGMDLYRHPELASRLNRMSRYTRMAAASRWTHP
jgi:hypothetical protein